MISKASKHKELMKERQKLFILAVLCYSFRNNSLKEDIEQYRKISDNILNVVGPLWYFKKPFRRAFLSSSSSYPWLNQWSLSTTRPKRLFCSPP